MECFFGTSAALCVTADRMINGIGEKSVVVVALAAKEDIALLSPDGLKVGCDPLDVLDQDSTLPLDQVNR
jgi:hypothetical protein